MKFLGFHSVQEGLNARLERGTWLLQERAANRNSRLYRAEFGGSSLSCDDDRVYEARDRVIMTERRKPVAEIAILIKERPSKFEVITDLKLVLDSWGTVSGFNKSLGLSAINDLLTFKLPDHWGALYGLCRSREKTPLQLTIFFGMIAMGKSRNWASAAKPIRTLLAFYFFDSFVPLNPPQGDGFDSYDFGEGWQPDTEKIKQQIQISRVNPPIQPDESIKSSQKKLKQWNSQNKRARDEEDFALQQEVGELWKEISTQWPSRTITIQDSVHVSLIDKERAVANCSKPWHNWYKNEQLKLHLECVRTGLAEIDGYFTSHVTEGHEDLELQDAQIGATPPFRVSDLSKFLNIVDPKSVPMDYEELGSMIHRMPGARSRKDYSELEEISNYFHTSSRPALSNYGATHLESLEALKNQDARRTLPPDASEHNAKFYSRRRIQEQSQVEEMVANYRKALESLAVHWQILQLAGLSPCTSIPSFLKMLAAENFKTISIGWQENLLAMAEAIVDMQRWRRLQLFFELNDIKKWEIEVENIGRSNWKTHEHPDWLLFEIESDITVRDFQTKMVFDIGYPDSGTNSVFQLGMGEGKTSVIIVLLAAALADRTRLVRVVLLKSLLPQTLQHLQKCLGGLMNRRVYYMPFTRSTLGDEDIVCRLQYLYGKAMAGRGVVVSLPEEILTLKFMGQERLSSDLSCARRLLQTERWLQRNCRNILDESDEILSPKHQVNLTVGSQQIINGAPHRWSIVQEILRLVKNHIQGIHSQFPLQVEVHWPMRAFPTIHFSDSAPSEVLLDRLVEDAIAGRVNHVDLDGCSDLDKEQMTQFMRYRSYSDGAKIAQFCLERRRYECVKIIRGLVAFGNLICAIQKRHAAEYGRDSKQSVKAVPYRAKDVPAERSEFAHPDLMILLTSIAHLKGGLQEGHLIACMKTLEKDPGDESEYIKWCEASHELGEQYPSLNGIDIADDRFRRLLLKALGDNYATIDFFLDKIVFPNICRHYTKKLCASSWDIPGPAPSLGHVTTGFSGTNDNRYLLPHNITQRDLDAVMHTTAAILSELLLAKNRGYHSMINEDGKRMEALDFIRHLTSPSQNFQVLIDVGAQILDLKNIDVAREMLRCAPNAEAALFFNEKDEAMVIDRSGNLTSLRTSSFRESLRGCLIYFDEAHTRGIDLIIPGGVRAAVTLGSRLEKDRLAQGKLT